MKNYLIAIALVWTIALAYGLYITTQYYAATKSTAAEIMYFRQQQEANRKEINQLNDWYFEVREKMRERK